MAIFNAEQKENEFFGMKPDTRFVYLPEIDKSMCGGGVRAGVCKGYTGPQLFISDCFEKVVYRRDDV